ncbi:hypothetical protein ACVW17_003025 [Bradyrhizobium sp. USDA 4473]
MPSQSETSTPDAYRQRPLSTIPSSVGSTTMSWPTPPVSIGMIGETPSANTSACASAENLPSMMMLALVNPASQALDEQPLPTWKVASHAYCGEAPYPPKWEGRIRSNTPVSNNRSATSAGIRRASSIRPACSLSHGTSAAVFSITFSGPASIEAEPAVRWAKAIAIVSSRANILPT